MKQSGVLQVPITPGMREDIDARAGAEPGTILYAQNLRFRKAGAAQRRFGTRELGTTTEPTSTAPMTLGYPPDYVAGDAGDMVVGANGYTWRYDDTESVWRFAGLQSSAMPVGRLLTMFPYPGSASHDAIHGAAFVAIDSSGYMVAGYCVNETAVGFANIAAVRYFDPNGILIASTHYSASVRARAIAVGATIYLVLQDSAATNAPVAAWTYSAGTISGSATTLFTLDAQADSWDASPWPDASAANRWLVTWYDSSSTTVTVRRLNALATEASATFTPAAAPRIACHAHTNHAWVGTVDDTSQAAIARCYVFSAGSLTLAAGPTNAWTFVAAQQDSSPPIFGNSDSATRANFTGWTLITGGGSSLIGSYQARSGDYTTAGTMTSSGNEAGGYPISYPFGPIGEYSWIDILSNADTANNGAPGFRRSAMVRRWRKPAATNDSRSFVELSTERNAQYIDDTARVDRWTRAAQRPNGNWVMPVAVWIPNDSTGAIYYEFLEFEAPCQTTRTFAYAAGALTLPGQPVDMVPDGSFVGPECGWPNSPVILHATEQNGAGALAAGLYQLRAIYKQTDTLGRVRPSAPSPIASVTLAGGSDAINLQVSGISWYREQLLNAPGQIEIYATEANGDTFYLVDDSKPANATTSYILSFANVLDNPILYTEGGVQADDLAPSCRALVASEDRMWAGPLWDRTLWQCSKIIFPEEPTRWPESDAFKVRFPEDTVTGAYMDGSLIVFSERSIYAVVGEGPDDRGSGGFGAPRCIVSGLGCSNERSVVMTPLGIFFESHRGIELLPRGLGPPTFIGAPVQDQLALRPTILDATFHVGEDATTVRFLVSGPEPTRPVFDAVSSDGRTAADGISFSFNHTLAAGNNRVVIVALTLDSLTGYGGVTASFNGVPMTEVASQLSAAVSGIVVFMLFDAALPFAGGSYSVAVTGVTSSVGTSSGMNAVCLSYLGAKQSAPSVASSSVASSVISDSLAMGAASLGVDFVSATSNNGTRSADAGQTERVNIEVGSHATGASEENGTGASVTMGWASTVSTTLTHVILELDPAFESAQDAVLTYDIDAAAWSVDTYPIESGALGTTPDGLLFANSDLSASPAFLLEDSTLATDDGVFFEGRLRLHTFYPVGYCGVTAYQATVARVSLDANPTTVNVSVVTDETNTRLGTVVGTDTASMKLYQLDPGNFSNKVTAIAIEAYDSTSGGATWHGFTLYHEPEPEMTHPSATTERLL